MTRTRTRATQPARVRQIDEVMAQVQGNYGEHTIHRADHRPPFLHIPTGIFTVDMATFGGVPEGAMSLVYGRESSGKTTLAMRVIAGAQRKYPDKVAVFVDIEGTYDSTWAASHGVDNERVLLVNPGSGEQALDIAVAVLKAEETSCLVVDSLAALLPVKEIEDSLGDAQVGLQARLIGKFCRSIVGAMIEERKRRHTPAVVLLNQWRTKIGVFKGDPRVLPGGMAQHFFAFLKLEMINKEHLGQDSREMEVVDHNDHSFKIAKNKGGNGIRSGDFTMVRNPSHPLGAGFIDDGRTVATWAKKMGLITGGGGAFRIDGVDGQTFRTLQEIVDFMYADLDWFDQFKRRLITEQRRECGLIAGGWY